MDDSMYTGLINDIVSLYKSYQGTSSDQEVHVTTKSDPTALYTLFIFLLYNNCLSDGDFAFNTDKQNANNVEGKRITTGLGTSGQISAFLTDLFNAAGFKANLVQVTNINKSGILKASYIPVRYHPEYGPKYERKFPGNYEQYLDCIAKLNTQYITAVEIVTNGYPVLYFFDPVFQILCDSNKEGAISSEVDSYPLYNISPESKSLFENKKWYLPRHFEHYQCMVEGPVYDEFERMSIGNAGKDDLAKSINFVEFLESTKSKASTLGELLNQHIENKHIIFRPKQYGTEGQANYKK